MQLPVLRNKESDSGEQGKLSCKLWPSLQEVVANLDRRLQGPPGLCQVRKEGKELRGLKGRWSCCKEGIHSFIEGAICGQKQTLRIISEREVGGRLPILHMVKGCISLSNTNNFFFSCERGDLAFRNLPWRNRYPASVNARDVQGAPCSAASLVRLLNAEYLPVRSSCLA